MEIKLLDTARATSPDKFLQKRDLQSGFWKRVFLWANEIGASDIHVENTKSALVVRCRIEGELQKIEELVDEKDTLRAMINRLKMICRMNLSVDDEAQDKSIAFELTKSRYRIALSPTIYGENFVFRVIKDDAIPSLSDLYLPEQTEKDLRSSIKKRQGFICITGPTGSGKSTTLQSILMEIDREKKKVITIENPVERTIERVMQKEISSKVDWECAIKMSLREDPDIILIGEIRDRESAQLALEAAQTGHLVYTTLHTNDVAGIFDRLIGLGVDRRLIAENILFASAQRLVQRLCDGCKIKMPSGNFTRGFGCPACKDKTCGVNGRLPVIEYSYLPDIDSIIHFNRKDFTNKELQTDLVSEIKRWIQQGVVDEGELSFWK